MKLSKVYSEDGEINNFGQWLKSKMTANIQDYHDKKITQAGVAKKLEISPSELSSLLNGYFLPSPSVLEKIFKGLRIEESDMSEAYRIIADARAHDMKLSATARFPDFLNDEAPSSLSDHIFLPGLVTVRRAYLNNMLLDIRKATGKDDRIFELIGQIGDGRDHFVKALTDAIRDGQKQTHKNSRVVSISFQGFWLRAIAFPNEAQVTQETIAEEILFLLSYPSPRLHGRNSSLEDYIQSLVGYFNQGAGSGTQHILTLYELRPEAPNHPLSTEVDVFETSILDLLGKVIERVPSLRVVLSIPRYVYDAKAVPKDMPRLDAADLCILAESLVPDVPAIFQFFDSNDKPGCIFHSLTIDQWALVLGEVRNRLRSIDEPPLATIFEEEVERFPNVKSTETVRFGEKFRDPQMTSAVNHYYNRLLPRERALLYASLLFPADFTVGDVLRLFQKYYPEHSDFDEYYGPNVVQSHGWWRERGQIRESLHNLARYGWLQSETRLTSDATSFRLRLSLGIYLQDLAEKRYHNVKSSESLYNKVREGFCYSLIEVLEDLFDRDILSYRQATEVRERIDSLYKAIAFAREQDKRDLTVSLAKYLCQFYSAEANWHLSLSCLNSLIGPIMLQKGIPRDTEASNLLLLNNDSAKHQLYRLRFLQLSYSYHCDEYDVQLSTQLRNELLAAENSGDEKALNFFLAELGHYYLFEVRRYNLIASLAAPDSAKKHALIAIKYLERAAIYYADLRQQAAMKSAEGLDDPNNEQSRDHAEVRDISKALAKAYYWKARTEAQMWTDWRTNPEKKLRIREAFLAAIAVAQDTESRREHVFCYIWLARIDFLFRDKEQNDEQILDQVDRSLVQARALATQISDTKALNILRFHRELLHLRKQKLKKTRLDLEGFNSHFDEVEYRYKLMGEQYWASYCQILYTLEVGVHDPARSLQTFKRAMSAWTAIVSRTNFVSQTSESSNQSLEIAPPPLFLDLFREGIAVLEDITSAELKGEKKQLDLWTDARNIPR